MVVPIGLAGIVVMNPEIVGGEPCFEGTRVPLETVIDNLAGGHSVETILENFPSLRADQIRAVLNWERTLARESAGLIQEAS